MNRLPRAMVFLCLAFLAFALTMTACGRAGPEDSERREDHDYLFCFWNAENLFDDRKEEHAHAADREFDHWFADDAGARRLKYENLSSALVKLNNGKGPDILALAEVE